MLAVRIDVEKSQPLCPAISVGVLVEAAERGVTDCTRLSVLIQKALANQEDDEYAEPSALFWHDNPGYCNKLNQHFDYLAIDAIGCMFQGLVWNSQQNAKIPLVDSYSHDFPMDPHVFH